MNNVYTKPGSTPVDIGFKNNTYAELSSGLDTVEAGIETDTGLFGFKNHAGAYKRCAPKSPLTALKIPVCNNSTTGECEDSVITQTASSVQINNAGTDRDLIVAGVSDAYGLYYDAALKRIGIGEGTPSYKLSITDANPIISLKDSDTNGIALINAASSSGSLFISADSANTVANSSIELLVDAISILKATNSTIGLLTDSPIGGIDLREDVYVGSSPAGRIYSNGNSLNFGHTINDLSQGAINYCGYNGGATKYRNLEICDGKNNTVAFFTGETGDVVLHKGNFVIPEGKGLYFCASGHDITSVGTQRITKSGNDILTERWDGGSWV
jgi:hypothetical protein